MLCSHSIAVQKEFSCHIECMGLLNCAMQYWAVRKLVSLVKEYFSVAFQTQVNLVGSL